MKHQLAESFADYGDVAREGVFELTPSTGAPSLLYFVSKRVFDVALSIILMPFMLIAVVALAVFNPFYNPGPIFYAQKRMGLRTEPFTAYKFRSMRTVQEISRGAHDPLELDRITPLGEFLRRSRIDEIPQILNVLKGDMSLVGPRPDYYGHARDYVKSIPGYRARHAVRPGISGFAQTEIGYADTVDAVKAKVAADLYYIRNRRVMLEVWIVWRTVQTIIGRKGA